MKLSICLAADGGRYEGNKKMLEMRFSGLKTHGATVNLQFMSVKCFICSQRAHAGSLVCSHCRITTRAALKAFSKFPLARICITHSFPFTRSALIQTLAACNVAAIRRLYYSITSSTSEIVAASFTFLYACLQPR